MTSRAQGHSRVVGRIGIADGKGFVRLTDRFDTDIDDLWSALTDPDRLARWLGDVHGDLHPGGEFRAHFLASDWHGTGRVQECRPPQKLLVHTVGADEPDEHVIEASLTADGDHTILVIEERGMPVDQSAAYGAGVQVHLEDLAAHLVGRERCDAPTRWRELFPTYQDMHPITGP